MDNNYYVDDEEKSAFSNLWTLIKLSWKYILVFCLAAAILMMCVTAVVLLVNDDRYIGTVVSYSYSGIEQGLNPHGGIMDTSTIKSADIVSRAISALGEAGTEINADKKADIIKSISIDGVVSNDVLSQIVTLNELAGNDAASLSNIQLSSLYPSSFLVRFNDIKKIGLSETTVKTLLDEITRQYIAQFKKDYLKLAAVPRAEINVTGSTAPAILAKYDYIDIFNILSRNVNSAMSYLDDLITRAPSYRSSVHGQTFNELKTSLNNIIVLELSKLEATITNNGLSADVDGIINELTLRIESIGYNLTEAQANLQSYTDAINNYKNGTITIIGTDGAPMTLDGSPTETYNNLIEQQLYYSELIAAYEKQLAQSENQLSYFVDSNGVKVNNPNNNDANRERALNQAINASAAIDRIIARANEVVTEYGETVYISSSISITIPATAYSVEGANYLLIMLIISALVVLIAFIASLIFSNGRLKKLENGTKRKPDGGLADSRAG